MKKDTTRKVRADEKVTLWKLEAGDIEEYEVEAIRDSAVYVR